MLFVQVPAECSDLSTTKGLPDGETVGFLVASANYAVAIRFVGTSFWPLFFWIQPPARQCWQGPMVLTSDVGSIGDGPGSLPRFDGSDTAVACKWILAPGGAAGGFQDVTLFFTEFLLTSRDYVHLSSCNDVNCTSTSDTKKYRGNTVTAQA